MAQALGIGAAIGVGAAVAGAVLPGRAHFVPIDQALAGRTKPPAAQADVNAEPHRNSPGSRRTEVDR